MHNNHEVLEFSNDPVYLTLAHLALPYLTSMQEELEEDLKFGSRTRPLAIIYLFSKKSSKKSKDKRDLPSRALNLSYLFRCKVMT